MDEDYVWVHDYHLLALPSLLRKVPLYLCFLTLQLLNLHAAVSKTQPALTGARKLRLSLCSGLEQAQLSSSMLQLPSQVVCVNCVPW